MTQQVPFPPVLDSTMIAAFRSCPQKMFQQYVHHWKPKNESVHLVAGGAFAKGVEVARKAFYDGGLSHEAAVAEGGMALLKAYGDFVTPDGSAKTADRMLGALEFYFETFQMGNDGFEPLKLSEDKHAIEFSFAEPLSIMHPQLGQPILYAGRCDAIGHFSGALLSVDEKTTTSLGASWLNQWDLRSQFTGYSWAAKRNGMDVQGALVRGISILKTKYDTAQVLTYRGPVQIERWETQLYRDIERMIDCWKQGYWDFNLDHACTEYGGCSLKNVCKQNNPEEWLSISFERRVWDPLAREEVALDAWMAQWGF